MKERIFGFQGIHLNLPEAWDLSFYRGGFDSGEFLLEDETQPVLHCNWGLGSGNLYKIKKQLIKKKGAEFKEEKELEEGVLCLDLEVDGRIQRLLLIRSIGGERHLLIRFLKLKFIVGLDLLHVIEPLKTQSDHLSWNFFAIDFELNQDFMLKASDFKSGCQRLEFQSKGLQANFFFFSMADRLFGKLTPLDWSLKFIHENYKKRYRFPTEVKDEHVNFLLFGKKRWRWNVSPREWLLGYHRIYLRSYSLPEKNQFCLLMCTFRKEKYFKKIHSFKFKDL